MIGNMAASFEVMLSGCSPDFCNDINTKICEQFDDNEEKIGSDHF